MKHFSFLLCWVPFWVFAQSDTARLPVQFDVYLEAYYLFDFGLPDDHLRPDFLYAFHRHNEVNINLGFVRASYEQGRVRAALSLMAGTYPNRNLAAEPGVLRNLYEANIGLQLSKRSNLWLEAGLFASHIGFESAEGDLCAAMTRSLLAENSPYYSAGVQLTYRSPNDQWLIKGLVLNGWQRLNRVRGNQLPAFGHQVQWAPSEGILLNSSSFIGSDSPDTARQMRYFHNFYGQFSLSSKVDLTMGLDVGARQATAFSADYDVWYGAIAVLRYAATPTLAFAARAEYYSDVGQVVIASPSPQGSETLGYSVNVDVRLFERVLWRLEGRVFQSVGDAVFETAAGAPSRLNYAVGTALSVRF